VDVHGAVLLGFVGRSRLAPLRLLSITIKFMQKKERGAPLLFFRMKLPAQGAQTNVSSFAASAWWRTVLCFRAGVDLEQAHDKSDHHRDQSRSTPISAGMGLRHFLCGLLVAVHLPRRGHCSTPGLPCARHLFDIAAVRTRIDRHMKPSTMDRTISQRTTMPIVISRLVGIVEALYVQCDLPDNNRPRECRETGIRSGKSADKEERSWI